jgi:hypothetical protein
MTDRDKLGLELLLNEPEFLAWLEPADDDEADEQAGEA